MINLKSQNLSRGGENNNNQEKHCCLCKKNNHTIEEYRSKCKSLQGTLTSKRIVSIGNKKKQTLQKILNHINYFTQYIPLIWNPKIFGI